MTVARFRMYAGLAVTVCGFLVLVACIVTRHYFAGFGAFLLSLALSSLVRPNVFDEMEEKQRMSEGI
jgi:hypothetical protein